MSRPFNFKTIEERKMLEKMLKAGTSVKGISELLGLDRSGLYKEINRGRKGNFGDYSAEIAQARYEAMTARTGHKNVSCAVPEAARSSRATEEPG